MKIYKQIREINGEKPDWIMDDIQDIGYWNGMETAAQIAEDLEKETQLNFNQQIVFEWLQSNSNALKVPMLAIYELAELPDEKVRAAYRQINREEEFQVLAAFAEWGMNQC